MQLSDIAARLPTEQYIGAAGINGPLVIVGGARDVAYGETVVVTGPDGRARRGRVVEVLSLIHICVDSGRHVRRPGGRVVCQHRGDHLWQPGGDRL